MDKMNLISYFWNHSLLSYRVYNEHYFLALRSYNPRQKSWHDWPLLQHLSQKLISSYPSPRFNVVYRDEFVIARFQHCLGGRGVAIPVMSLLIVCKIACQRIFMLSDSGVPRTFVGDCSFAFISRNWAIQTL